MDKLATITPYATGATIKDMVNEALITAIRDGRDVITWQDVIRAKQLKELGPPEDVEYIERERHAVAVHEACHALVAYRTRQHMEIDIATIEKGSDYLGMVASIPPEDQFTRWRSEYETDILVSLASLAGERMFFDNDSSSGVSGDLESATTVASFMEGFWGMGSTVSSYSTAKRLEVGSPGGGQGGRSEEGPGPRGGAAAGAGGPDRGQPDRAARPGRADHPREPGPGAVPGARAGDAQDAHRRGRASRSWSSRQGPLVDGRPVRRLVRSCSSWRSTTGSAAAAHREHSQVTLTMPAPAPPAAHAGCSPWAASHRGRDPNPGCGPDRAILTRRPAPTGCGWWPTWSTGPPWRVCWWPPSGGPGWPVARNGLLLGDRYRLPVPPGACVLPGERHPHPDGRRRLQLERGRCSAHEARHATQYACCGGLVMLPLYCRRGGRSWVLTGDFGARNVFERRAGLADGGYTDRPLRPAVARWARSPAVTGTRERRAGMRFHRVKVLRRLPHPGRGFTQGLITQDGTVWESTGQYGQSALRRYRLGAQHPEACAPLPPDLFAEGICRVGEASGSSPGGSGPRCAGTRARWNCWAPCPSTGMAGASAWPGITF